MNQNQFIFKCHLNRFYDAHFHYKHNEIMFNFTYHKPASP